MQSSEPFPLFTRFVSWFILALSTLIFMACGPAPNQQFTQITDTYFQQWPALHPTQATQNGMHRYDHLLSNPTSQGLNARRELYTSTLQSLKEVDPRGLTAQKRIDFYMLRNGLRSELFQLDTLREHSWNPLVHVQDLQGGLLYLISNPDSNRVQALISRLFEVPAWTNDVQNVLANPSPVHTQAAIEESRNLADWLKNSATIDELAEKHSGLMAASHDAAAGLESFAEYLEDKILPHADRDFRLGGPLYSRKMDYMLQMAWSPDQLISSAEATLKTLYDELYALSADLAKEWWSLQYRNPGTGQKMRLIQRVINRMNNEHPDQEKLAGYIASQTDQLRDFTHQHKLLTLNRERSLEVHRGSFPLGAPDLMSLVAPGILDNNHRAVLYVQEIPGNWTSRDINFFQEDYNTYTLQLLSIHHGIPGAFVQQASAARYPSLVRFIYANPLTVQGWAHYAERMVVEEGWNSDEPGMQIIQIQWEIRRVLEALIDFKVHTQNMSESEALTLLTAEGFFTRWEAQRTWRKVELTSANLPAAYLGKEALLNIRSRYKQLLSQNYSLQEFHNQVLSFGAPPLKYIRSLLIQGGI